MVWHMSGFICRDQPVEESKRLKGGETAEDVFLG